MTATHTASDIARRIRTLILDVDGVLTDGALVYGPDGECCKTFHAHDGLGIRLAQWAGIEVAVITARSGPVLDKRMADLRIRHFFSGYDDKTAAFSRLLAAGVCTPETSAYMGDDILDLPILDQVALPMAPANAHAAAKRTALYCTTASGGAGAVREAVDWILSCRGDLDALYRDFLTNHIQR